MGRERVTRRRVLGTCAGAGVLGLAGCNETGDDTSDRTDDRPGDTGEPTTAVRTPTTRLSTTGVRTAGTTAGTERTGTSRREDSTQRRTTSPSGTSSPTTAPRTTQDEDAVATVTEAYRVVAADGDGNDRFGSSIAVDGTTALVGAPQDEDPHGYTAGSAYAFERTESRWTQRTKLLPETGEEQANFGHSVDVDADTAFVGARGAGGGARGAVYVFGRDGDDWTQRTRLTVEDGEDRFGEDVALQGDVAVVSAAGGGGGGTAGAAYVFERREGSWTRTVTVAPWENGRSPYPHRVALDSETFVVGASRERVGSVNAGVVYVYERTSGGWTRSARLAPPDPSAEDWFGRAVALRGDTAFVGAPQTDGEKGSSVGRLYAFERSGGSWSLATVYGTDEADPNDFLGWRVNAGPAGVVASALGDAHPNGNRAGACHWFQRGSGGWEHRGKLVDDGDRGDRFGSAVAVGDDFALVGQNGETNQESANFGSVSVFDLDG